MYYWLLEKNDTNMYDQSVVSKISWKKEIKRVQRTILFVRNAWNVNMVRGQECSFFSNNLIHWSFELVPHSSSVSVHYESRLMNDFIIATIYKWRHPKVGRGYPQKVIWGEIGKEPIFSRGDIILKAKSLNP